MSFRRKALRRGIASAVVVGALSVCGSAMASDYYLDANYAGVNGAPYLGYTAAYNSITAALNATTGMPQGTSASNPNRLLIAPGTYNTVAPGTYVGGSMQAAVTGLIYSAKNTDLIGLGSTPDAVVITSTLDSVFKYNGTNTIGTSNSATLQLKGANQAASNITFGNSTDTPYIVSTGHQAVDPNGNYVTSTPQTASQPAVALLLQGDGQAFSNCKFLGYQDTLYTKGGRAFFSNCTVSGDNDFIFANGTSVFQNSTINIDGDHSGGCVTAASTDKRTSNGLVFLNSTVTSNGVNGDPVIDPKNAAKTTGAAAGSMYLGRPWGWQQTGGDASAVFINPRLTSAINAAGWLTWVTTNPVETNPGGDSRFAEYNSTDLNGNAISLTGRVSWSHQLTASQAADYTVSNLFSVESVFPWYGKGYPAGDSSSPGTGSPTPGDPNYSYPAFWGDRNTYNFYGAPPGTGSSPAPSNVSGNPTSYNDPSWTAAGTTYDPTVQMATFNVPEPGSMTLLAAGGALLVGRRRRSVR